MKFTETQIYIRVKKHLLNTGWEVIAGQPPSGSDHLPVIEIKDHLVTEKGSLGAFKPDLVAWKANVLLIIELKPLFEYSDVKKLNATLESPERQKALWEEISTRNLRTRQGDALAIYRGNTNIVGGLGYGGELKSIKGFIHFNVQQNSIREVDLS